MPYNPLAGLTEEERYLTIHIRGGHGPDSPPDVTNGNVYDTAAYDRNIMAESALGERQSEEREELFKRQSAEYMRRFSVALGAPEAPLKDQMTPLTKAQIESRKLALLAAACRMMNPSFLHSGQPRDVEHAVDAAVKVARQLLAKIDETESPQ